MLLSEIINNVFPELAGTVSKSDDCEIQFLLTDSRSLEDPKGSIFFAIPTRDNDGHRYIRTLYEEGVRVFVANHVPEDMAGVEDARFIIVDDTVTALQRIGSLHPGFEGEILAITGSRGKTTLKEWIFQLMEPVMPIVRSPRSFNSQIGVALSMWEIKESSSLAIIEAGISRKGEMQALADCIAPHSVIITNIGPAHSEGFASSKEKALEKALLASAPSTRLAIFSADDAEIAEAVRKAAPGVKTLTWSAEGREADISINFKELDDNLTLVRYTSGGVTSEFVAPLAGKNDYENAANALAFMLHRGIDREMIADRFASLHKIGTRLNVAEGMNGCSVIYDQYTSDFSSLRPALDFMRRRQTPAQTSTLILSDLHHEDVAAEELYRRIASMVKKGKIDRFIGIGPALKANASLFPEESRFFGSASELLGALTTSDFYDEIILIKGSPEFDLSGVAERLEARKHETVLEVNLDSLISNYNYFRGAVPRGVGMVCMVKASGYGAGSFEIAKTLQDCGAAYLAVAVLDEGADLRRRGITMPIMIMNPKASDYKGLFANHLEPNIFSFEMLEEIAAAARKYGQTAYPVHLKLDTGMHRMGFTEEDLPRLMDRLSEMPELRIRSVFSHLATADCPDMDDYTLGQLRLFDRLTDYILRRTAYPVLRHILNSAGILRFPEWHYDMVRLGIGLYGANTLPPEMEKPLAVVSSLRTVIIAIHEWEAGESIGYGRRTILRRRSRIATIPIGYADGMNRHLGRGNISVMVNGRWAPTVGNICMDACMIDVTDIECETGDAVEIFGKKAPLNRLSDLLDTIPYEVLTSVSPRVKRIYYRE